MTENYPPAPAAAEWREPLPPLPADDPPQGTTDVVQDQASQLSDSSVQAGQHVAGVAQEQASQVVAEAGRQGRDLLVQAQQQLGEQTAQGQQRLADELLSLGDELGSMADGSQQNGVAADLARQASARARNAGQWLDDRRPAQVLDEVQAFARRRPGAFLALALGAGLVAGRLTRGLASAGSADDEAGTGAPAATSAAAPELSPSWASPAAGTAMPPATAVGDDGTVVPVVAGLPVPDPIWPVDEETYEQSGPLAQHPGPQGTL